MPKKEDINDVIDSDSSYKAQGEAFAKVLNGWKSYNSHLAWYLPNSLAGHYRYHKHLRVHYAP